MGFRKVTLGLRSLRSREWGFAIPSGKETFWFWSLKLAQVGTIFAFFHICSAFFGFPHSSWLFPSICFHFSRFFFDFSSILSRFREGFSMIFDTFFETCQNVWKSTKHCVGAWILKVDSYKNKQILPQNCKKTMQIYDQKKTSAKIVQKSDLGGSWAPFGKGLGRSGASWGHFWAHFDCLLDVPNHIFLKQWSKMGSKRPFGWLLDRFSEGLGRIWMRLGRIWAFKIKAFASHGHFLNTLGVPCCLTLCYRNPRAASLRLAERHNWKCLRKIL